MDDFGVNTPGRQELANHLHIPIQALDPALAALVKAGEVRMIGKEVYYTSEQLTKLAEDLSNAVGNRPFEPGTARDALKTSRKYIIPLLQYFDEEGITRREGDQRLML